MKKVFALVAICLFALVSGICLTACEDTSSKFISISGEEEYIETIIEIGGTLATANEDGKYEAKGQDNVKISFYAKQYGINLSNLVVKANDKSMTIQKNGTNFDSLHDDGDLYFGYIKIPKIEEDIELEISGVEPYKNVFVFEGQNLDDETTLARLNTAEISFDGQEYKNLKDFLTGDDDKTFSVDLSAGGNLERNFYLKFDGSNPYDLARISPFTLQRQNQQEEVIAVTQPYDGVYTISLGDVGSDSSCKVLVDFKKIVCNEFKVTLPQNNKTFSIGIDEEELILDYETSKTITITTPLPEEEVKYENMKVFLNDHELQASTEDSSPENTKTYTIPDHLTPAKTGNEAGYTLRVTGIEYVNDNQHVLKANSTETNEYHQLVLPKIVGIENEEQTQVYGVNENGDVLGVTGQKNAVVWTYPIVDGYYRTAYDLYDYDIFVNDEKVLNLKEALDTATEQTIKNEHDKVYNDHEGKFVLKAFYNETTQKYDSFAFEFDVNEDTSINFGNFKTFTKNVNVGYDFDYAQVEEVRFAVGMPRANVQALNWSEPAMKKAEFYNTQVQYGQTIYFRLKTRANIENHEFVVAKTIASDSYLTPQRYIVGDDRYIVFAFNVSDVIFDGEIVPEFKLVRAGQI